MKKKLVALTGSGISAESGIPTFRDSGGLWEGYDVMDVASPEGWYKNRELVLNFYNDRRKAALNAKPNLGHYALADLEEHFEVTIITQNVDNLHERAGSTHVIHLHGELFKSRSTMDESLIYDIEGWKLNLGDLCEKGHQLRPHIVWFGEMVPMMEIAAEASQLAEIYMVIGTSLLVYPAASLVNYIKPDIPLYIVDPKIPDVYSSNTIIPIEDKASTGVKKAAADIIDRFL